MCDALQEHVFADWPAAGTDDAQKKKMLDEIAKLDRLYAGGLEVSVQHSVQHTSATQTVCHCNALQTCNLLLPQAAVGRKQQRTITTRVDLPRLHFASDLRQER